MSRATLSDLVDPGWARALYPVRDTITTLGDFLRGEIDAGRGYLPSAPNILRAFSQPLDEVKVLILGQDPYPTPGHAMGLAFSVQPTVRPLPRSLRNIYRELEDDLGISAPPTGDLSAWANQGVLLLNRVLTVGPGRPGSHRGHGWEQVTDCAMRALGARQQPLVAVLWGRDAQSVAPILDGSPLIQSAHPSPMSADRGFFGSRPFSRANAALAALGATPIDWRSPAPVPAQESV